MRHGRAGGRLAHVAGPDPRGRRVTVGGLILAAGEGRAVRRHQAARASCDGRPLLEHALAAVRVDARPRRRRARRTPRTRSAQRVDLQGARAGRLRGLGRGPVGVAALRPGGARTAPTRCSSRSATSRGITPAAIDAVARGGRRRGRRAGDATTACRATRSLLRAALLARAGELRGDAGFRDLLSAARVREVEVGHLADARDVDTREELAGDAMKLEQSFEVQAPRGAGVGGADRPRARRAVPAGRGDHRARRGRHLPRRRSRSSSARRPPPTAARSRSRRSTRPPTARR